MRYISNALSPTLYIRSYVMSPYLDDFNDIIVCSYNYMYILVTIATYTYLTNYLYMYSHMYIHNTSTIY